MRRTVCWLLTALSVGALPLWAAPGDVVINEIAWMGTTASVHDEWIELHNTTDQTIALAGWTLNASDGSPLVALRGGIPARSYFLLERTDDNSVVGIAADQVYFGALENPGNALELRDAAGALVDRVDAWHAGDNPSKASMERTDARGAVWNTATRAYAGGLGTPRALNSQSSLAEDDTREQLNQVAEGMGAINVYFNKRALSAYATPGNRANHRVNLERRLLRRLAAATETIDLATYEINLPDLVDALIGRAAAGVRVRVIADAKDPDDPDHILRYEVMRLHLERLARGRDGQLGTQDDVALFADSVIFAVEDPAQRAQFGLPPAPQGLPEVTVRVGNGSLSGHRLAEAEQRPDGGYFAAGQQMHNKFALIDGEWVWTGSWNFTVTGLYGSEANRQNGVLGGNTQHAVELRSRALAAAYQAEFDEMWGATGPTPDPQTANFHARKSDNTPHRFDVGGRAVELYFSPGDDALGNLTTYLRDHADASVYFTIFAWSDQPLVDTLKAKWEGSTLDRQGSLTGFEVRGVFDASFWNQWWSASIDMTARTASRTSENNPNTRWAHPAPVFRDAEVRKLHAKTMLVDVCTDSAPAVVVGSTNWSTNGNDINDENLLIIHDAAIANQFLQAFYARYAAAGGEIPPVTSGFCQ